MPRRRGRSSVGCSRSLENCRERLPFHQFHREERPVAEPADIVDRHHARVLELPANLGLFNEPPGDVRTVDVLLEEHLDGQISAEVDIAAAQHRPHAAAGDFAVEPVTITGLVFQRHGVGRGFDDQRALALGFLEQHRPHIAEAGAWRARVLAEGGRQAHVERVGGEGAEIEGRVRCLARAGPAGSGIVIGIGIGGEGFVGVVRARSWLRTPYPGEADTPGSGLGRFSSKKNPENRKNLRKAPSRGSPLPLPTRPRCPDDGTRRPPGGQTETPFWQERRTCERSPDRWPSGGRCL